MTKEGERKRRDKLRFVEVELKTSEKIIQISSVFALGDQRAIILTNKGRVFVERLFNEDKWRWEELETPLSSGKQKVMKKK